MVLRFPPSFSFLRRYCSAGPWKATVSRTRAEGIHPATVGIILLQGGLFMLRQPGSRAVQLTACRHPASWPRAGLPEAGRRVTWDGNMISSMS